METIIVNYHGEPIRCIKYTNDDEANLLAIVPAWREYARRVRVIGKSPQIPSAFSQAFCCLKLNLVNRKSDGADAFRLDHSGEVLQVVELKATATLKRRNDIKIYANNTSLENRRNNLAVTTPAIEFDELYWFAADPNLTSYSLYKFLPEGILEYDRNELPKIRGGRINVDFGKLLAITGAEPFDEGAL